MDTLDEVDFKNLPPELPDWAEELAKAAYSYDGHVTNGSLLEMVAVVKDIIHSKIAEIS